MGERGGGQSVSEKPAAALKFQTPIGLCSFSSLVSLQLPAPLPYYSLPFFLYLSLHPSTMASIEELTISDSEEAPQLIETSERQITVSPLFALSLFAHARRSRSLPGHALAPTSSQVGRQTGRAAW